MSTKWGDEDPPSHWEARADPPSDVENSDAERLLATEHRRMREITSALSNLLRSKIPRNGKAFNRYATLFEMVFRLRHEVDCDHGETMRLMDQILILATTVDKPTYMGPTPVMLGRSAIPSADKATMSPDKFRLIEMIQTLFRPMHTCSYWGGIGKCNQANHTHDPAERKIHSTWNFMLTNIRNVSRGSRLLKGDVRLQTVSLADVCNMFNVPAPKPVDAASDPVDLASKPVDAASDPVDLASKPVDVAPKPVDLPPKPVDVAPKPVEVNVPAFKPVKEVVPAFVPVQPAPVLPMYWSRMLEQAATPAMYAAIEKSSARWGSSYHLYRQLAGSYFEAFYMEYSKTLGPLEICWMHELALYTPG